MVITITNVVVDMLIITAIAMVRIMSAIMIRSTTIVNVVKIMSTTMNVGITSTVTN